MPSKLARSRQRARRKARQLEARQVQDSIQRLSTIEQHPAVRRVLDIIQEGTRKALDGYVSKPYTKVAADLLTNISKPARFRP
jgi:hypothetical protein